MKLELEKLNIFTDGMQTIIGEKNLREQNIDILPEKDFSLFILPQEKENKWLKYVGTVKFDDDPIEYQRKLRNEWE